MKVVQETLPIDETLTPQNAFKRGYVWEDDVAYVEHSPVLHELIALIEDGYLLGCARDPVGDEVKGLYRPLVEQNLKSPS